MSNIFKKITSIEPEDSDILNAIKTTPEKSRKKGLRLSSIEEENVDNDPVPDFITREKITPVETQPEESHNKKLTLKKNPILKEPSAQEETIEKVTKPVPAVSKLIAPAALSTAAISETSIESPSTRWMKWAGILSALVWIAASFSYFYGFFELRQKWTDLSPIQICGLIMAIILPAVLLTALFYTLRQLSKLSAQSQNLQRVANQLTQPDDSVIAKTNLMSQAIKNEVDSVDARIEQALARMKSLEDVLNESTRNLEGATGNATQTTDQIASRLSTQRLALESIAGTFDDRMNMLSTSLTEHTTNLDSSTKLAEQKIQEARVSVEGAAERINAASNVVRENTIDAASTLTQSHEEIENLANMIRERSAELDEVYRKHAQDLTGMISELRDEQQNLSLSLDERLSKMRDMSLSAKVSAESLKEASDAGRNTVEALAEAARLTDTAVKQRFTEMEDMVKFSNDKAANISDQATQRVQDRLVQTRKEISRIEDDMLAMQTRLATPKTRPEQEQVQENLALETPSHPPKPRKSRLKLRPVKEDKQRVEEQSHKEQSHYEAPKNNSLENKTHKNEAHKARSKTQENDELGIPSLRSSLIAKPMVSPEEELKLEIDDLYIDHPREDSVEQYSLDTNATEVIQPDIIQPVENKSEKKKERSTWRWRDMLGGLERPGPVLSEVTSPARINANQPKQRSISNERMIASLSALGLSPTAIVDDGCIIEATNTRRAKGAIAMSQSVAHRIGTPIKHLHKSMEDSPALKTDAQTYVAQFNTRIDAIETDREAIRNSLETDAGRAFLLCDAALNG